MGNDEPEEKFKGKRIFIMIIFFFTCISQSMMVTGALNVCVSTIERLYKYKSFQVAAIDNTYNGFFNISSFFIGFLITGKKLKWISGGCMIISLGCLIFCIPVAFQKIQNISGDKIYLCRNSEISNNECRVSSKIYLFVMCLGYAVIGIGSAPIYTITVNYIQEISTEGESSVFNAIFFACSGIGPAIIFVMNSFVSKIPLLLKHDNDQILNPEDENWIGAYWLLYIIGACLNFLSFIFIFLFSILNKMPAKNQISLKEGLTVSNFISKSKLLILNKPYILLLISMFFDGMMDNAIGVFLAKYIEVQFQISTSKASLFAGIILVSGAITGLLTGGLVMKFKKIKTKKLTLYISIVSGLSSIALSFLLCRCEKDHIEGIVLNKDKMIFDSNTAKNCKCDIKTYFPVCVDDKKSYYSPCAIGCKNQIYIDKVLRFVNCTIPGLKDKNSIVVKDRCRRECNLFKIFLILGFVCLWIEFTIYVPQVALTIRLLSEDTQLCGLSIQQIVIRTAYIIGPMYQGYFFDLSCLLFSPHSECDKSSNCIDYNNNHLSLAIGLPAIILKGVATIILIFIYRNLKSDEHEAIQD